MVVLKCAGSNSEGNCYSLTDSSGQVLLIEAGVPRGKVCRLINWNITNVVGCVVTHHHLDHVASAPKLKMMGVEVFSPFELDEHRREVVFGNYRIKSFPLTNSMERFVHTNGDGTECPVYGFLIEHDEMGKMVYLTDCEFCKWRFTKLRLNHMLIGVNYQEKYAPISDAKKAHVISGHMSESTAIDFIKANQTSDLQNIILGHLSEFSCNAEELVANVKKVAETGVSIHVATPKLELELRKDCPFG